MKKEILIVIMVAVVAILALQMANQIGRLESICEATHEKCARLGTRLLPLEEDLQRREGIRKKALALINWIGEKIGG